MTKLVMEAVMLIVVVVGMVLMMKMNVSEGDSNGTSREDKYNEGNGNP